MQRHNISSRAAAQRHRYVGSSGSNLQERLQGNEYEPTLAMQASVCLGVMVLRFGFNQHSQTHDSAGTVLAVRRVAVPLNQSHYSKPSVRATVFSNRRCAGWGVLRPFRASINIRRDFPVIRSNRFNETLNALAPSSSADDAEISPAL